VTAVLKSEAPRVSKSELDISQDALYGIAQLALDTVDGVKPMASLRIGEILSGRRARGIRVERSGDSVAIDLHVRVLYGLEIPWVAREAQRAVREAVTSMTGLKVRSVDVTVEAVDVPEAAHGPA
jgi:uncharacterized alkaline shock family protein YloU